MIEQGKCPKCEEHIESFGVLVPEGESIYYPFECKGCGFEGKEYYNVEFSCFYDNDGNEIE